MYFSTFVIIVAFCLSGLVDCTIDISAIPRPQPYFNTQRYSGLWFNQGKIDPWTWPGSQQLSDWTLNFRFKGSQFYLIMNWRSGPQCASTSNKMLQTRPGHFLIKDPIGDIYSGDQIIIATDYSRFSITWGCIKRTPDGMRCSNPWLSVETREVYPSPKTYRAVDWVLTKTFGFRFNQMRKIIHTNPC